MQFSLDAFVISTSLMLLGAIFAIAMFPVRIPRRRIKLFSVNSPQWIGSFW